MPTKGLSIKGFCGDCVGHPRKPDWLGNFYIERPGEYIEPPWDIVWFKANQIGSRIRAVNLAKNLAARERGFVGPVRQPRLNPTLEATPLEGTLKVKCRHGHDCRRRADWIRAQIAERIEQGSERPIYL